MASKVSVIVPTHNRKENVIRTLLCLWDQEIQPQHTMEILVVDHASDDGSVQELIKLRNTSRFETRILEYNNRPYWSPTFPKNYGARQSDPKSEALIFVDSDVMLPPDRIQRYIDLYLRGGLDPYRVIIGAYHQLHHTVEPIKGWWKKKLTDYTQDVRWKMMTEHDPSEKLQGFNVALACFGGNILIPRQLFFKAGGFDEHCTEGEDGDFGLTMWECGAFVSMDTGLLGWHNPHEIVAERRATNWDTIHYIDRKHHVDVIKETGKNFRTWGVGGFKPPKEWIEAGGYTEEEMEKLFTPNP